MILVSQVGNPSLRTLFDRVEIISRVQGKKSKAGESSMHVFCISVPVHVCGFLIYMVISNVAFSIHWMVLVGLRS